MTTQDCVNLQNEIDNVLLPTNLPNRVTSFGNTITQNVDQWVTVINARPNAAPTESNGYCTNMMTDVSFRILYSKTGFYANPQNQIVGFEINYGSLKDLQYQCPGLFCDDVNRALISQSVSFIDVSTTPVSEVKPKPKFRSKAPNDFFYPFL
ncbi:tectonic-3-like isoform X3 [Clytia hemisphaerica]|uniref:tectonic-3-like isoform X3 n=1 Tax=Clytia hemisphaerica TaxID=252671 RepID=UPI0034D7423F